MVGLNIWDPYPATRGCGNHTVCLTFEVTHADDNRVGFELTAPCLHNLLPQASLQAPPQAPVLTLHFIRGNAQELFG